MARALPAALRATRLPPKRRSCIAARLLAAGFIAIANTESLWLPWLLLCPLAISPKALRSPAAWGLLSGAIPLVSMHPLARWLVVLSAALFIWKLLRPTTSPADAEKEPAITNVFARFCV